MKKGLFAFIVGIAFFVSPMAEAVIIDSGDIGGFGTFRDLNTGRTWLDMDNFFNMSTTDMVAAASSAGFTFANKSDLSALLGSLPLTSGEWSSYASIMGDAPNRELIWGAYDHGDPTYIGWAWAYNYETSWNINDFSDFWNNVPNGNTSDADLNIWAYYTGEDDGGQNGVIPEPMSMMLLGSGLAGLVGFRKRFSI